MVIETKGKMLQATVQILDQFLNHIPDNISVSTVSALECQAHNPTRPKDKDLFKVVEIQHLTGFPLEKIKMLSVFDIWKSLRRNSQRYVEVARVAST